jgi:hypothetical protein
MQAFDWRTGTEKEHFDLVRNAPPEDLPRLARSYDWSMYPEAVLGWVMAQKGIDLGAALEVFFNGEPERFNYMRKHDVPEEYHGAARVLDNICLRVNAEGRRGRWILDETILNTLLEDQLRFDRSGEDERYFDEPNLVRDLFSPIMELELSRRILRMLPIKSR